MKLLIIIINYRTADLTVDCLRSLADEISEVARAGGGGARVVVSDNASGDASAARIAKAIERNGWSCWASVLPLPINGGFSYGNNSGMRPALESGDPPEYVMLLNPDTLARPGALTELLDFMDRHPRAGIAGSRLEDPDGTPQCSAFRFPSVLGELDNGMRLGPLSRLLSRWTIAPPPADQAHQTDWVGGASFIIRRQVIESVGLMDEGYFMYFEEVDFCRHARRLGWTCWYVPRSRVIHLIGQASGVTGPRQAHKRRPAYWFESRRRYFVRNHGRVYAAAADAVWIASHAIWRLRRRVQPKPSQDPARLLGDFVRHSVWTQPFAGMNGAENGWKQGLGHTMREMLSDRRGVHGGIRFARLSFRQCIDLIREDYVAHGRDWTKPGFRAVATHRFGNWRMNVRWKLLRFPLSVLYRHWYRRCRDRGIELDYSVTLGRRVIFEHQGAVVIHGNSTIGDDCIIRHGVTLGIRSLKDVTAAPILGHNVEVGAGAKILGRVRIGDGAKIGANTVVLSDVPPGATAVGIPSRIVQAGDDKSPDRVFPSEVEYPVCV